MNNEDGLLLLAVQLRYMQFYAHMAHNVTCGPTFYQDHKAFGSLYEDYQDAYDAVIERFIGLGGTPFIFPITKNAVDELSKHQDDEKPEQFFKNLSECETKLRSCIDDCLTEKQSEGTKNFLQGLADESEQRTYKLNQRIK